MVVILPVGRMTAAGDREKTKKKGRSLPGLPFSLSGLDP
jgi:hypothetical protein